MLKLTIPKASKTMAPTKPTGIHLTSWRLFLFILLVSLALLLMFLSSTSNVLVLTKTPVRFVGDFTFLDGILRTNGTLQLKPTDPDAGNEHTTAKISGKNYMVSNVSFENIAVIISSLVGTKNLTQEGNGILNNSVSNSSERKTACNECLVHNFKYVIQNENICKVAENEIIDLFVFILTIHKNADARNAIRRTWMSVSKNNMGNIRYAFLLGEINDENQREAVRKENEEHRDILKENFVDHYNNLTYKTIMGFKWTVTHCAHARYVMKTDDDMFVNTGNLLNTLRKLGDEKMNKSIIGSCSKLAKPIRDQKSKWFASVKSYPESTYPGFCSGTGYATSMKVVQNIYKISPNVPFFHLEDVYIALCARKLGFELHRTDGFNVGRILLNPCVYKGESLITSHGMSPSMLREVWNKPCKKS